MQTVIRKIGNSKGAVLPASLLKQVGLDVDDKVLIEAESGRLIIEPVNKPEYTLDELLSKCQPDKMSLTEEDREWLNDKSVGTELKRFLVG